MIRELGSGAGSWEETEGGETLAPEIATAPAPLPGGIARWDRYELLDLHAARGRALGELYHRSLDEARRSGDRTWLARRQRELQQQLLAPGRDRARPERPAGSQHRAARCTAGNPRLAQPQSLRAALLRVRESR